MELTEEERKKIYEEEKSQKQTKFLLSCLVTIVLLVVAGSILAYESPPKKQEEIEEPPSSFEQKSEEKADRILAEQKSRVEQVTRDLTKLLTEENYPEIKNLLKNRWNELANLRVDVMYDGELTEQDKQRVGNALKADQEGVTDVLSKYEELFE